MQGKHTRYYRDIVKPPEILADDGIELTDLFLGLWVSPNSKSKVLDEAELENAFSKSWITKRLYDKAKKKWISLSIW